MIAVALSPKARALIQAHRDAPPTAADRERVAAALRARLGATVLPLETVAPLAPPARSPLMSTGIQRRFAAAFGVCVVGSALFLAQRPEATLEATTKTRDKSAAELPAATATVLPNQASTAIEESVSARPNTAPSEASMAPAASTAPDAPRHARVKAAQASPPEDTFAQELALLTSAASQLSAGQASGALQALEEHQRRFSHGALSAERNVAKARALCALHRFDEGRAALARLPAGTPAAARVKEACDSAWARAHTADASHTSASE